MYRVGVIGDKDSVLGFTAIGFEAFPAENPEQAERLLRELSEKDFAVLYLTEQYAAALESVLVQFRSRRFPAIIPIPGVQGGLGIGMAGVKQCVEKAVGADILFNE